MDLNHIELPITTIVDFYGDSLVLPGAPQTGPKPRTGKAPESLRAWPSLGGNGKHILLAVYHPGIVQLPDNELAFITRILVPCKLNLDDVAIINLVQYQEINNKDITDHFNSKKVILFGRTPVEFGMHVSFPDFQLQGFQGIDYLSVPALNELENEEALKRKFWECLKQIFNLKG